MHNPNRLLSISLSLITLLAGCGPFSINGQSGVGRAPAYPDFSPTPVKLLGRLTTPATDNPTRLPPVAYPSDTPQPPTEPPIPQPEVTKTWSLEAAITPTFMATVLAGIEPTANEHPFQICTPVADILLEDLPRLISDGYRPPLLYYSDARHPGIDIAFYNWKGYRQISGAPVQSVLPGRVALAEKETFPLGNVVIIETDARRIPEAIKARLVIPADRSLYLLYAHMQDDSLRVSLGQEVTACQTIGQVGKSGNAGAAHLHLENRIGPPGMQMVGFAMYTEDAGPQQRENYRWWATSGDFRHFDPLRLLLYEFGYEPTPARADRRSD